MSALVGFQRPSDIRDQESIIGPSIRVTLSFDPMGQMH